MITLYVDAPYASFRKSYARSFAETYPLPPPATVYGMLLSLVGEHFRRRHEGVRLAFAYRRLPRIATTLRKLSRYKYGVASKQSKLGNAPDFVETLCGIEFLCWIDSAREKKDEGGSSQEDGRTLEERITEALHAPADVDRSGVLCLGLSDDAVNDVRLCERVEGKWHRLLPSDTGSLELPVWVDHVGAADTRWRRYQFEPEPATLTSVPGGDGWEWTEIVDPRITRSIS
ncbi:MAG: type I-MYXAN CRISPR-associated protein Cas5/Cmx5/DevS [Pyrinomonadaceae bacterium]|nr:type I-MYXAN CRISPR-associated protein Cas5/Cmx5/DevS [Pyrinomonadaceae bacterium]